MRAWTLCCFHSLVSTQGFRRALTASVDSCAEIKSTADNFGLFTEIAACKFLRGLEVVWPETIFILSIVCVYTLLFFCFCFSLFFRTAHCALYFARDHAP